MHLIFLHYSMYDVKLIRLNCQVELNQGFELGSKDSGLSNSL